MRRAAAAKPLEMESWLGIVDFVKLQTAYGVTE